MGFSQLIRALCIVMSEPKIGFSAGRRMPLAEPTTYAFDKIFEPVTGIEPATYSLRENRSTPELHRLVN